MDSSISNSFTTLNIDTIKLTDIIVIVPIIDYMNKHLDKKDIVMFNLVNKSLNSSIKYVGDDKDRFIGNKTKTEIINDIVTLLPICQVSSSQPNFKYVNVGVNKPKPNGTAEQHRILHVSIYLFIMRKIMKMLSIKEMIEGLSVFKPQPYKTIYKQNFMKRKLALMLVQGLIDLNEHCKVNSNKSMEENREILTKLWK